MNIARKVLSLLAVVLLAATGCSAGDAAGKTDAGPRQPLRLGYFPNVTHAAAFAGLDRGLFARHLAPYGGIEGVVFTAGPQVVEALFTDAIDAAYIGPNPAINAYQRSQGQSVRMVAGAASKGASLVVGPGIAGPADLKGKSIATPQLGNTQDVALRHWLKTQQLSSDQAGGGDVKVLPQENAQTLELFKQGKIDGAWAPEPWASRLVIEAGGTVLVDESALWPGGHYLTAGIVVRREVLDRNPAAIRALLRAHVEATDWLSAEPESAMQLVNEGIARITNKTLAPGIMARAWENVDFTYLPLEATLQKQAANAIEVGLLDKGGLGGIYDLRLLDDVLRQLGKPGVAR